MNRRNNRRRSLSASGRHRRTMKRQPQPPVMWNIQGMRGKMSSNCLWHACQALFVGILLFFIGGVMSFLGFHADGVFDERGNQTAPDRDTVYTDSRSTVKFSKLSYAGPIVMGFGGFIIVATCVMTFEARDSAAKVGPAAFVATRSTSEPQIFPIPPQNQVRTRSFDVRSVASQTVDSSTSLNTIHIFDRRNIMDTFKKFSKTLRTSSSKDEEDEEFHRSPSAPNLLQQTENLKSSQPNVSIVPTSTRRSSCLPKFRNRVPPTLVRQSMSVECSSSSPFLQGNPVSTTLLQHHPVPSTSFTGSSHQHYTKFRKGIYRTATNTSSVSENCYNFSTCSGECPSPHSPSNCKGASSLSVDKSMDRSYGSYASGHTVKNVSASVHFNPGTVDLHLPNGLVTLSVVNNAGGLLGSSTSLRTLSPHPSFQSQSEEYNSSFDRGSVKSESSTMPKSPMMHHNKPPRLRSSDSACRPTLMRQTKVDQSEIICIPDSDDEPIPEEDSEQEGV